MLRSDEASRLGAQTLVVVVNKFAAMLRYTKLCFRVHPEVTADSSREGEQVLKFDSSDVIGNWFTKTVPVSGLLVLNEPAPNQLTAYSDSEATCGFSC